MSITNKNRFSGTNVTFDNAGNLTNDGTGHTYSWDAENQLTTTASVTYTHDGDGQRVKKSNGTLYWYGLGGEVLAETDLSGNNVREFVYFGGARIARRENSGAVYYFFGDHLGTAKVMTSATGVTQQESTYYPFGSEQRVITNTVANQYKFTGLERDAESGLDHTLFRMYPSNLTRWLSPDPMAGDILNPQSLNRYPYVMNNPTNFIDPLGLFRSTFEPVDCDDPGIAYSHAQCGGYLIAMPPLRMPSACSLFGLCDVGGGGGDEKALDVSKTWEATFPCSESATELMASFQSNMGAFADFTDPPFAARFPGAINKGDTLVVRSGLQSRQGPFLPMNALEVTVTSKTANSWTFTTNPQQHYFNGTVTFQASDVGAGSVHFVITANAKFSSPAYKRIGPIIKAGENSTWNNLLRNVQNSCSGRGT